MEWIKGRDLLEPPYNRTMREVFKAVQEGILVPWESPDAEYIKKHEKHAILGADFERIWRAFPTPELQREWVCEVLIKKRVLKEAQEWLLKSDEEHIEAHKQDLELYQCWGKDSHRSLVSLEEYKNRVLPEERQQKLKIINEYPSDIEKLEKEFAPGRVWRKLGLGPAQQESLMERLLGVWYKLEEVKSILKVEQPKRSKTTAHSQIVCKPGTRWDEIEITLITDDMVKIKTQDMEKRYHYSELGLSDKRIGDAPKKKLWHLFILLAERCGNIAPLPGEYIIENLSKSATRLNKHLQNFFGIDDTIYLKPYNKEKRYVTKFRIEDRRERTSKGQPYEDEADKDRATKNEIAEIFDESAKWENPGS